MMKLFAVFCISLIFIVQDSFGYRINPYPVDPSPDDPKPIINVGVIRPNNPNKKRGSNNFVEPNNGFLPGNNQNCHWDPQRNDIVCIPTFDQPENFVKPGNPIPPPIPPFDGDGNGHGGRIPGPIGGDNNNGANNNDGNEEQRIKREWDPNRGGWIIPW